MQTNTQNIIVETNGLGSVVKIDTKSKQSRPEDYEYHYDVYFVPNDGTLLETETTVWDRVDYEYHDYTDIGGESAEYTYTYQSEDTDNCWVGWYDVLGCLAEFIGYDYKQVIGKDDTDNIYEVTDTNTITISGRKNEFRLQVIGSGESASSIHYCKTRTNWKAVLVDYEENHEDYDNNWSDEETVYIRGNTEQPHTYTNFILFNGDYQSGGIPEKYMHFPFTQVSTVNELSKYITSWQKSDFEGDKNGIGYGSVTTKKVNIELTQRIGYVNRTSDDEFIPIMSGLLYSDCHFVLQFAYNYKSMHQVPSDYYSDKGFQVYTTKMSNGKPYISTMELSGLELHNNDGLELQSGPHRWLSLFQLANSFSSWYADDQNTPVVIFVDRSGNNECNLGTSSSKYARATKYWYNYTDRKVMTNSFSRTKISNKAVFPIFKPYAECDLIVFEQKDGEPFATEDYRWFERKMNFYYHGSPSSDSSLQTRVSFLVNSAGDERTNMRRIKQYAKTISPFRNEFYICHGARREYDVQNSVKQDGRSGICYSNSRGMGEDEFQRIHNVITRWSGSDICLGIVLESCFGGGVQQGLQRNRLGNGTCWDASKLVKGISNVFYYVEATATHIGLGNSLNGSYILPAISRAYYASDRTYKSIVKEFNNLIQRSKNDTFILIKDFFQQNYDKFIACLDDDDRAEWNATKSEILSDLSNAGRKYFATYDWEERWKNGNRNENYYVSDNYFDAQKKYNINGGFIGYIKSKVFPKVAQHHPNWYFSAASDWSSMFDESYIERKVKELENNVLDIYSTLGVSRPENVKYSAIYEPVMGCSGKYKNSNTKFMKNPDEKIDAWLTSDDELLAMAQQ